MAFSPTKSAVLKIANFAEGVEKIVEFSQKESVLLESLKRKIDCK